MHRCGHDHLLSGKNETYDFHHHEHGLSEPEEMHLSLPHIQLYHYHYNCHFNIFELFRDMFVVIAREMKQSGLKTTTNAGYGGGLFLGAVGVAVV